MKIAALAALAALAAWFGGAAAAVPHATESANPTLVPATSVVSISAHPIAPTNRYQLAFRRNGAVYVVNDDRTGLRKLGSGAHPSWSPDGRRLVVANRDWLQILSLEGSATRTLTGAGRGFGPSWSPDGKQIAFTSRRSGAFAIFATTADGKDVRRVSRSAWRGEEAASPAWSPDGTTLVFASTRVGTFNPELYTSRLDGTGLRRLTHTAGGDTVLGDDDVPAWSPDGRRIIFSSNRTGDGALWVMRRDGSGERMLLDYPRTNEWFPRVSPDGSRISFTRQFPDGRTEVWLANIDGTGARRFLEGSDAAWSPVAAAPASARRKSATDADAAGLIAFAKHTGAGASELYVIRPDGSGLRKLSAKPVDSDPAWTPDGRRLVFASSRGGRDGSPELYVRDISGSAVKRITHTPRSTAVWAANLEPAVASDGERIVFVRDVYRQTSWTRDLYSVSIEGGPVRQLTSTPARESTPAFGSTPALIFERDGWIYETFKSAIRRLTRGMHPAKSPSRQGYIAFADRGAIWVTAGGRPWRVAEATPEGGLSEPAWSGNGSQIVYVAPDGLYVVNADGTGNRLLAKAPGLAKYRAPAWRP